MNQLTYSYKAVDAQGSRKRGVLQAENQSEAYRQLTAAGLKPIKLTARRAGGQGMRSKRVGAKELAHLTYQFSVLMEARIPIADGLRSIAEQERNLRLQEVIEDVARQIEAGYSITEAMSQHRSLFGDVYIETVRAAEVSGNMVKVLARLAEMLEMRYESNKNINGALIYPICVLIAMILGGAFLMIVIVPKFAGMYENRGVDLPYPTQLLLSTSAFVRTAWPLVLAGIGGAIWAVRSAWRSPATRHRMDTLMHKLPFLREVLRGLAVSRFSHVLGTSLQSGLGLIDALEMAGGASGRPLLQADTQKMREQVKEGGRLTDVMLACAYLPGFARRMIAAGEETAEMPRMCEIVARHYDREVAHLTKNLPTVLEPILIVGLAGVFLIIALAIFLPMWELGALMG
ncbi:MAG: type II secretion system F family protein [Planctomycetota bacterium]|jgi:type II secretory pathway component PulF